MKAQHIEERLGESDDYLTQVADVILELRANAERLERVLQKLKEEDDA